MAVEGNKSSGHRRRGSAMGAIGRTSRSLRFIMQIIAIVFLCTLAIVCLFGYINQVQTGQSMIEYFKSLGAEIGDMLQLIFTGQSGAPIDITDQGVYIDGYAPDGASNIMDGSGSSNNGGE